MHLYKVVEKRVCRVVGPQRVEIGEYSYYYIVVRYISTKLRSNSGIRIVA